MTRKILLVIIIVVVLIAVIAVAYFSLDITTKESEESLPALDLPEKEIPIDERINRVSERELAGYWLDRDGRLYLVETNGIITNVSPQTLENLNKITPSGNGMRVVAEFSYPSSPSFSIFDVLGKSWTPLPAGTIAAVWHPEDSDQLIYLQNSSLKNLNLKTKKTVNVIRLNLADVVLIWPESNRLLISDRPSALIKNHIWELDLKNKKLKEIASGNGLIIKEKDGLQLQFTGSPNRFTDELLINYPENNLKMSFGSLFNDSKVITLPEKCAINGFKVYCAVPVEVSGNILLPDDYYKRKFVTEDAFYVINIDPQKKSAAAELVYDPETQIDAVDLVVSDGKLYFINKVDSRLYSIKL